MLHKGRRAAAGAAVGTVPVTIVQEDLDGGSGSSYTMNIGTASSDRYVVVCIAVNTGGDPTSLTVGATTCTKLVAATNVGRGMSIWVTDSAVTTGTSATVAWTDGATDIDVTTYSLKGAKTPTSPNDTGSDITGTISFGVNVKNDGGIIALGADVSVVTQNIVFTGVSSVDARGVVPHNWDGATGSYVATADETPRTITSDAASGSGVMVAVSWDPV